MQSLHKKMERKRGGGRERELNWKGKIGKGRYLGEGKKLWTNIEVAGKREKNKRKMVEKAKWRWICKVWCH